MALVIDEEPNCDEPENEPFVSAEDQSVMPPPPASSYPTLQLLKEAARVWSKERGYELVVTKSMPKGTPTRLRVQCGRSGKTKNTRKLSPSRRQRATSSHKSDCPFLCWYVADNASNPDGSWSIRHGRRNEASTHNHEPLQNIAGTANQRRFERTEEIYQEIKLHAQAGIYTKQSVALLRTKFPNSLQTKKDISNAKHRFRQEVLKAMSVAEATLKMLDAYDFFFSVDYERVNQRGELFGEHEPRPIRRLFIAHPKSL